MTQTQVEVDGRTYELDPQPIRTSLTDGPTMLWGFEVRVLLDGRPTGVKTCFVGRASVQFTDASALQGGIDDLLPVLHRLAFAKIAERLRDGEDGDEILFA